MVREGFKEEASLKTSRTLWCRTLIVLSLSPVVLPASISQPGGPWSKSSFLVLSHLTPTPWSSSVPRGKAQLTGGERSYRMAHKSPRPKGFGMRKSSILGQTAAQGWRLKSRPFPPHLLPINQQPLTLCFLSHTKRLNHRHKDHPQ